MPTPRSHLLPRLGLLLTAALSAGAHAQAPADPYAYARTSTYTYYQPADGAKNGLLKTETVEPGNAALCATVTHDYDDQGNLRSSTTANCAGAAGRALFASRTGTTSHGGGTQTITVAGVAKVVTVPEGQFPTRSTNALEQAEAREVDPRFGAVLKVTGPNELSTRWEVDDFGRRIRETRADGTRTLSWYCLVAADLDASSNTVLDGQACPAPAAGEVPASALQYVHSEERDAQNRKSGPFTRVYTDRAGREIRSVTEGFDGAAQPQARRGALIVRDIAYNAQGLKTLETQPYWLASGASTLAGAGDRGVTRNDYDALGRLVSVQVVDPNGSQPAVDFGPYGTRRAARRTLAYDGLASSTTDDRGRTRREEKNANGQGVRITDPTGAQLVHQHDAFGNLVATKDALGNRITIAYDLLGRKLQMNDPDAGVLGYCHDALGQLKAQQNSAMRGSHSPGACPDVADSGLTTTRVTGWTTLAYDKLGRLTQRVEAEFTSTWSYDRYADGSACAKGQGKLCESRTDHGVRHKLVYDSLGRLANRRTELPNGPRFATALGYDADTGRQVSQTYPTGVQVSYGYTALGYPERLTLATTTTVTPLPATPGGAAAAPVSLAAGSLLWQAQAVNAWGKSEQQVLGNGITSRSSHEPASGRASGLSAGLGNATDVLEHQYGWDSIGNLTSRGDANGSGNRQAVSETFSYDALDRLSGYTVAGPQIPNLARSVTLQYNALGMLLYKSDVGNYAYGAQGAGGLRPHALLSVSGAGITSYGYDANGNRVSADGGKARSIGYTSFNLPDSQGGAQGPVGTPRYQWLYDQDHARVKETRQDGSGTRTTWFLHPDNAGGLAFESESHSSGTQSQRHYLSIGGQAVGVLVSAGALPDLQDTQTAPAPLSALAAVKLEYWHKDHLGSLAATTDHAGTITARYAYDPYGKRRFTQGTYDAQGTLVADWSSAVNHGTDRGFTGHEHLDDLGLIHMNGRIYDPQVGRFLSADPQITFPGDLQNYDRYAYVLNNPMATTDPTGLDPCDDECKRKKRDESAGSIAGMGREVQVIAFRSSGTAVDHKTTEGGKPSPGQVIQAVNRAFEQLKKVEESNPDPETWGKLAEAYKQLTGIYMAAAAMAGNQPTSSMNLVWMASRHTNAQTRAGFPADNEMVGAAASAAMANGAVAVAPTSAGGTPAAPKGTGEYGSVLGHHVHAKRAFEGVAGYDRAKAFAVSDKALADFGVRHADVTAAQQRLFRALDASGAPNTLAQHSRVAYQALVEAGVPASAAKQMVIQSQSQLIRSGVVEPARIPWGTR